MPLLPLQALDHCFPWKPWPLRYLLEALAAAAPLPAAGAPLAPLAPLAPAPGASLRPGCQSAPVVHFSACISLAPPCQFLFFRRPAPENEHVAFAKCFDSQHGVPPTPATPVMPATLGSGWHLWPELAHLGIDL